MEFKFNGHTYSRTEKGYCYKGSHTDSKGNEVMTRIGQKEFEDAKAAFEGIMTMESWQEEYDKIREAKKAEQVKSDKAAEDAMNKCGDGTPFREVGKQIAKQAEMKAKQAKAKKAAKQTKNAAWTAEINGETVILTEKQVDFFKHMEDTNFWENGLDSTPWIDILAEEIGGQFANKPMTVGAMVSTLREKGLLVVGAERVNGHKAKYFALTELGKEVGFRLGLDK